MKLYTKITIGLIAGVLVGWLLNAMFNSEPFEQADKDGNSFLSLPEILSGGNGMAKYRDSSSIAGYDADNDGQLSLNEIIEKREGDRVNGLKNGLDQVDINGDGSLSLNEIIVGPKRCEASSITKSRGSCPKSWSNSLVSLITSP